MCVISTMTREWFGKSSVRLLLSIGSNLSRLCLASLICLCMLTVGVGNAWGTAYKSYVGDTQQASTTISSSNVSSGTVGVISWTGTSCTYSSSRVNIAASGSITFTASSGYEITKIVITSGSTSSYYGTWTSSPAGGTPSSANVATLQGFSASSVTVTTSTDFRCTSASDIKIYYTTSASSPSLTPTPTSLSWGTVNKGASLTTKTFDISGSNLTGNLSVATTGGYTVSCGASITVTSGSPTVTTITVTAPSTATAGTKNGTITISGGGLGSNVTVSCGLVVNEIDQFIDEVQSTSGYTSASPHVEAGSYGTTPSLSDKAVATSGTCEQQHYHFVGWITKTKYDAGTSIAVGDLQTPTTATGAKYYAVWAKQGAGSGTATGGITQSEITTAAEGKTAGSYADQSASSASGNWTGKYAWNTQNSKKVMQINATSGNSIISPTFSGAISNIAFVYTSNTSSNKTFTLKDGATTIGTITATANAQEGSGSASISGTYILYYNRK